MFVSNIIPVEDVLVRPEIGKVNFSCDLHKCKGACCTIESEYGAPLHEEEIEEIEKILPIVKEYLPREHLDVIESRGFYEFKSGELLTNSLNNRACVFVYYENDIAKCGIEKAYFDGKVNFRKPISCHLFPIRVSSFGGDVLRYETLSDCKPALKNGDENGVSLVDFCKDSLVRLYGENWYKKFKEMLSK